MKTLIFQCLFACLLAACSNQRGSVTQVGSSIPDRPSAIAESVIKSLNDYQFNNLVLFKSSENSLVDYKENIELGAAQLGHDILKGKSANWLIDSITIANNAQEIGWSLQGAQISVVPGSLDYHIISQGNCTGKAALSPQEQVLLNQAAYGLFICQVRDTEGPCLGEITFSNGLTVPIPNYDTIIGHPHQLLADLDGVHAFNFDITGAHWACYVHNYICGDKTTFLTVLSQILESHVTPDCPANRDLMFSFDIDFHGNILRAL